MRPARHSRPTGRFFMTERKPDHLLACALAFALAFYPLLRGGWDLWAQLLMQLLLLGAVAGWFLWRLALGSVPLPPKDAGLAALALFLGFLSLQFSPVHSLALPQYRWWCAAVLLSLAAPFVPQVWRARFEPLLLVVGVATVPLLLYQAFLLHATGSTVKTGPFFNENMYAGYLLMLLPLAAARRSWLVGGVLLLGFAVVGSRGAFVALAGTAALWAVSKSRHKIRWGAVLLLCLAACGVALSYSSSASVQERMRWWQSALNMIGERPLFGFGPGSFEYVFPAFRGASTGLLSSVYAHSWPLQFAAEYGLPCAAVFLGWLLVRLRKISGGAFWAVTAVLLHSLVDFTLYSPAIFFIFCWLLACDAEAGETAPLPSRSNRAIAMLCAGALAVYAVFLLPEPWLLQKQLIAAKAQYSSDTAAQVLGRLDGLSQNNPDDSTVALLYASALARTGFDFKNREQLSLAAAAYERALRLNPFRPATYAELAAVYEALGRSGESRRIMEDKDRRFPS